MERTKIIAELKAGNYSITSDQSCDCSVDSIMDEGVQISGNECWQSKSLMINNELVLEYVHTDGYQEHQLTYEDLYNADLEKIANQLQIDDSEPLHTDEQAASMIEDFLEEDTRKCYVHYPRKFANEYKLLLCADIEDENGIDSDDYEEIEKSEWAELAANTGDDATQIYKSFDIR